MRKRLDNLSIIFSGIGFFLIIIFLVFSGFILDILGRSFELGGYFIFLDLVVIIGLLAGLGLLLGFILGIISLIKKSNDRWKPILAIVLFLVYIVFFHSFLAGFFNKGISAGDCLDVSKYDPQGITKYCVATGYDKNSGLVTLKDCDTGYYSYGTKLPREPLANVNLVDAHKVNKKLCN